MSQEGTAEWRPSPAPAIIYSYRPVPAGPARTICVSSPCKQLKRHFRRAISTTTTQV